MNSYLQTIRTVQQRRLTSWAIPLAYMLATSIFGMVCVGAAEVGAIDGTNAEPAEAVTTNSATNLTQESALTLANRRICVFRTGLDGYTPEERAAAAEVRLHSVIARAKAILVSTNAVPAGIQISLDGKPLFVITPGDVSTLTGQTLESEAATATAALRSALQEIKSLSSPGEIGLAIGEALLGFFVFAGLVWAARRAKRWLLVRSTQVAAEKTEKVSARSLRTAGLRSFVRVLRAMLNFCFYVFTAFLGYVLLCYELRRFPYSRPWGDFLRAQGVSVLSALGQSILTALPNLMVVALIAMVARTVGQVLSRLFATAERGEIKMRRLDPATAKTTRRILIFLVWVIAVVIAYPYIPGSQTLAFKGVTVFAGLLISLGSTNIVNQIASGLVLVYSHAFLAGDYVRVGDTEGTVLGIGMCVTRIRTVKNEEIHIVNNVLLGTATKNYTRLAKSHGLLLPIKVTIGYGTPWRQVHAMLLEAARRTKGLATEFRFFVLQSSLSDFYVEYELNVCIEHPEERVWVQSALNENIQDVFNEYGVQIMSPHYWHDPPRPQVVPKADWFLPPAVDETARKSVASQGAISPSSTELLSSRSR